MSSTKYKRAQESPEQRSGADSARWIFGLVMTLMGLFGALSIIFYLFDWKSDYDIVTKGVASESMLEFVEITNPCGHTGAWLAEQLVGRSFGIVGIIIPIFLLITGIRITRRKPLRLHRTALLSAMVMLFGSATLGAAFGVHWPIFNSGLGGMFGIEITQFVSAYIGAVGVAIILLGGWIATGVFINRNFITVVNNASSAALGRGGQIVSMMTPKPKTESERQAAYAAKEAARAAKAAERAAAKARGEKVSEDVDNELDNETDEEAYDEGMEIDRSALLSEDDNDEGSPFKDGAGELDDIEIVIPKGDDMVDEEHSTVVTVEANELQMVSEADAEMELYDPLKDLHNYQAPPVSLLEDYKSASEVTDEEIYENKSKIEDTLKHFGISIQRIKATVGPTITLYEIVQAQGIKISKIQGLENDIAQSLEATGIRIIAPIPGRGTIGIEVPNRHKQVVSMYSSVRSAKFNELKAELPIVVGRTIQNECYVFDLAKMPHLLVAGATGQGKSVGLNAIITSLLYRKNPSQLKFVMIDPKMVEFTPYKSLEHHFMAKMESEDDVIITDPKKAVNTLNSLCEEMEKRLKLLSKAAVRNIVEYNDRFVHRRLNPENGHFYMPYIVVIVDEFADLIMMTREVETPVMRLAQKARAVGIHLIIATQRPDVKVITGGIKANFPARIAFRVMQMIDSRTIIDQPGANQLIGRGDMLFSKDGELTRIQCALVETEEVGRIVEFISEQQGYPQAYFLPDYSPEAGAEADMGESSSAVKYDVLFAEIARAAVMGGTISTSSIQRNFEVGFNRAGRIMTQLERAGIVGRAEGAKPREILYFDMPSLEAKLQSLGLI